VTSQAVLVSRDLALELHRAFAELDRGWPFGRRRRAASRIAQRLAEVRDRLGAWLDATPPAEPATGAEWHIGAEWHEVQRELAALDVDVTDRTSLVALRTRVQPTYEAIVERLAEQRVTVPSLRPTNYARNALHLASAISGVVALETVPSWGWATGVALTVAALGWTLEIARQRSEAVNRFCMGLFGRTAHPHEAHRVNSATWYASALVVLSLTQALVPCLVALWVLGVGDPAAAIVGRRFGRRELVHGRTVEGTVTFVVAGALVALAYLRVMHPETGLALGVTASLTGALAGALAELFSRRIDDNLSIPLAACLGAALGQGAVTLLG
jgi:dolichol kinase